jgi:hypothetical protein
MMRSALGRTLRQCLCVPLTPVIEAPQLYQSNLQRVSRHVRTRVAYPLRPYVNSKTPDKLLGLNGLLTLRAGLRAADDVSKMLPLATARTNIPVCPAALPIGTVRPTSDGSPRSKDPFLPLYAHH